MTDPINNSENTAAHEGCACAGDCGDACACKDDKSATKPNQPTEVIDRHRAAMNFQLDREAFNAYFKTPEEFTLSRILLAIVAQYDEAHPEDQALMHRINVLLAQAAHDMALEMLRMFQEALLLEDDQFGFYIYTLVNHLSYAANQLHLNQTTIGERQKIMQAWGDRMLQYPGDNSAQSATLAADFERFTNRVFSGQGIAAFADLRKEAQEREAEIEAADRDAANAEAEIAADPELAHL